jgi:uncharacterized membrane protein YphA (DoxX/SURF4 family)
LRQYSVRNGLPAGNPIANVLVVIAGVLAIGVFIVLGFFAFVALSAIFMVTAAIIGVRVWWFKRKLQKASPTGTGSAGRSTVHGVIEGEYHEVQKDRDET